MAHSIFCYICDVPQRKSLVFIVRDILHSASTLFAVSSAVESDQSLECPFRWPFTKKH